MTKQEVVAEFQEAYSRNACLFEDESDFYCGITNDLKLRAQQHNATFLLTFTANSFEAAKKLEQALHDAGFDTGKQLGNGQEDSVHVYMYKKIPGVTRE